MEHFEDEKQVQISTNLMTSALNSKPYMPPTYLSKRAGSLESALNNICQTGQMAGQEKFDRLNLVSAECKAMQVGQQTTRNANEEKLLESSSMFSNHSRPEAFIDKPYLMPSDTSKRESVEILPDNIKKRRSISVQEKLDIMNLVDAGCKVSQVARKFGISSSTASTIIKERHKIKLLADHYNIDPGRKRMRLGIYRDVDEAVHLWFRQMKMKNIAVNGPMLQQKAREFALQLGHPNFEGSSGWLFRFRERHGLCGKKKRENNDAYYCCTGVGMTDDEIVSTVSQNMVHAFSYPEKDRSSGKHDVPENYLVPNIELCDRIQSSEIHQDGLNVVPKLEYEGADDFEECGPIVVYENSECNLDKNTEQSTLSNNPYEYANCAMNSEEGSLLNIKGAMLMTNQLQCFLEQNSAPEKVVQSLTSVKQFLENDLRERLKQKKITDFFVSVNKNKY